MHCPRYASPGVHLSSVADAWTSGVLKQCGDVGVALAYVPVDPALYPAHHNDFQVAGNRRSYVLCAGLPMEAQTVKPATLHCPGWNLGFPHPACELEPGYPQRR